MDDLRIVANVARRINAHEGNFIPELKEIKDRRGAVKFFKNLLLDYSESYGVRDKGEPVLNAVLKKIAATGAYSTVVKEKRFRTRQGGGVVYVFGIHFIGKDDAFIELDAKMTAVTREDIDNYLSVYDCRLELK